MRNISCPFGRAVNVADIYKPRAVAQTYPPPFFTDNFFIQQMMLAYQQLVIKAC